MPMNILRNDCPGRGMERVCKRQNLKTVRWYVLTLPIATGGRHDRVSPSGGLNAELSHRGRCGKTLFEYFAPSYVGVRKVDGKLVNTRCPLLSNYVFTQSSVKKIFRMKRTLPLCSPLPRVSPGGTPHFPYPSDGETGNLR